MTEDNKKTLPKDFDSDYSLPGRFEESNPEYFGSEPIKPKPQNRVLILAIMAFVIVSAGSFTYYFINQDDIDSRIIQNVLKIDPENNLINQYNVGQYGSDHAHAAIAVFVDGEQLNFALPQFQLSSKYIHFENHNPYLLHKHATNVPLKMLFASIGMKITQDCIILNYDSGTKSGRFCNGQDQDMEVYVNGQEYHSEISEYVLQHNDRILISFGDSESIQERLAYLESLKIPDVPKKTPQYSGNDISV